jgi:NitT/TauT family transport system ATP-binding protein
VTRRPDAGLGAIRATGVDFGFVARDGSRLPVLDGIDLAVPAGGIVALIGPNGSGKSTLLRVMAGLLHPDGGKVTLDGAPVDGPEAAIGLVFQEPRLLPWRSAASNITYPLELAGWPADRRAARLATLIELVDLDTGVIGNRPSELSGGTRQRVSLARALALEPEVLLLDEPTASLDADATAAVEDALRGLRGVSLVLVTHDPAQAERLAERTIRLRDGGVVP